MNVFIRRLILLVFLFCLPNKSYASQPQLPTENDTLNYTQVYFNWQPVKDADQYRFQIKGNDDGEFDDPLLHDLHVETNATIVSTKLEWGQSYLWRYWSIDSEGNQGNTSVVHSFCIMELPEYVPDIETEIFERDQIQPGLTIFGQYNDFAIAVDIDGEVKLAVAAGRDFQMMPDGELLSIKNGHIFRTNINGDIVFYSDLNNVHHEVDVLPNGNYLTLKETGRWVPTPDYDGDSLYWTGDVIIEIDEDENVIWSWNTHDYFSYEDYEPEILAEVPDNGNFDWTHGNACHYLPDENVIYASFRNLSRITLIDYDSKEIIWNMGKKFPSGDVDFGQNINFSYQHDPEWLPDGNILLFDNHNDGPEDSSSRRNLNRS